MKTLYSLPFKGAPKPYKNLVLVNDEDHPLYFEWRGGGAEPLRLSDDEAAVALITLFIRQSHK